MARQRAGQISAMFKFLAKKRNVSLPQRGQTGSINNDLPIHWVQQACSPVLKWPVHDTDQYYLVSLSNKP